jgi:NADH-quinone oxidoreductase subunit K
MGVELILNAAGLNFIAFAHYNANEISGHIMTLFIIILAAAEAVVALALILAVYRKYGAIDTDKVITLKE